MKITHLKNSDVRLYIGSCYRYSDEQFLESDLLHSIEKYQKSVEDSQLCSLRISPTSFKVRDYYERGWEVVAINYPRFPKEHEVILEFMLGLAEFLILYLNQNRISVIDNSLQNIILIEADDAEE